MSSTSTLSCACELLRPERLRGSTRIKAESDREPLCDRQFAGSRGAGVSELQ